MVGPVGRGSGEGDVAQVLGCLARLVAASLMRWLASVVSATAWSHCVTRCPFTWPGALSDVHGFPAAGPLIKLAFGCQLPKLQGHPIG